VAGAASEEGKPVLPRISPLTPRPSARSGDFAVSDAEKSPHCLTARLRCGEFAVSAADFSPHAESAPGERGLFRGLAGPAEASALLAAGSRGLHVATGIVGELKT